MKKILNSLYCLSFLVFSLFGCSKNEPPASSSSSPSNNGGSPTTSCSTISAGGSVTSNGVSYHINALSGSGSAIGIEVLNSNGAFTSNYSMQLLEVSDGGTCATSSSSTETLPGFGKYFEFKNMPAFASKTTTVAKVKIMLDGTVYAIQDLHVNQ